MTIEHALFKAALELEEPAKRRAFVEKACASDPELLRKVQSLLQAHDKANSAHTHPSLKFNPKKLPRDSEEFDEEKTITFPNVYSDEIIAKRERRNESDENDEEKVDLSFLTPSTKHGFIGFLGHYAVIEVLGQGGFGIVFKAFDEKLRRLVAIKVMKPQIAATSPPRKRFLREARAVAAIKNENVVQVYSVEEQPLPYMVMEFIDGQTLQQKLDRNGPLEVNEILNLGRQIANALASAHALGIIHRDIKPGNVLLEQVAEQKVKITDFGLARAADDASMTRTGLISGTPLYMSPEQALGQQLDHRTDLFSLGSLLYQMACGRAPFRAPTVVAVLRRVVDENPRPIQQVLPEIPDWLAALIVKLHAKKPEDRFQSAREIADLMALYQVEIQLHGSVISFTEETPLKIVAKEIRSSAANSNNDSQSPITKKKTNKVLFGSIVAMIAITGLFAFSITRNRRDDAVLESNAPSSPQKTNVVATSGWNGWPDDAPPPAIAPFNDKQAKQHQEDWAKYLKVRVAFTNSIGIEFQLIPPGEFMMGSTEEEINEALPFAGSDTLWQECIKSEGPQHKVIITQPFYLGVHEVTQSQYQQIMKANPSYFSASGKFHEYVAGVDTSNLPVESVSWSKALRFCRELNVKDERDTSTNANTETLHPVLDNGYRLPTEAEWEFACRAGTGTQYCSGTTNSDLSQTGWSTNTSDKRTHDVGNLQCNSFGLHDMHGNVWEWVLDAWDPTWYVKQKSNVNPFNPPSNGSEKMTRGGNYCSYALSCRSGSRCSVASGYSTTLIGCRVALSIHDVRP